jgi:hypothetical protein
MKNIITNISKNDKPNMERVITKNGGFDYVKASMLNLLVKQGYVIALA